MKTDTAQPRDARGHFVARAPKPEPVTVEWVEIMIGNALVLERRAGRSVSEPKVAEMIAHKLDVPDRRIRETTEKAFADGYFDEAVMAIVGAQPPRKRDLVFGFIKLLLATFGVFALGVCAFVGAAQVGWI